MILNHQQKVNFKARTSVRRKPQTHEPWTKKTCSWTQVWNSVQTWAWRPRSLWTWRPQKYVLLVTTAIYSQHARQDTSTREHVLILVLKTLAKTAWLPKLLHRNMFCFVSALFGNWILSHFLCLHTYHILEFLICLTHWIVCVLFDLTPCFSSIPKLICIPYCTCWLFRQKTYD